MSYGSLDLKSIYEGEVGDDDVEESQDTDRSEIQNVGRIKGLNILSTTLFIAGEMAGSGILALPRAVANTGYIGIALVIIFCINAAYSGVKLGSCWNIVEERYREHRTETRNPYSIIALKAVGKWGSILVSNCIRFTLFGAGTVYLLLSSHIIQNLLTDVVPNLSSCTYFILIAVCMIPPVWLSSPKEFTLVGMGAILSTVLACILYFIQIILDAKSKVEPVKHQVHGFHDFFLSFGTILFAFGGASTFPTIQNDMENRHQFSSSVSFAFIIIMMLYFPISAGGFLVYGDDVKSNITLSLTKSLWVDIGDILMAIHLILAFLIVMNPVCQDVEEAFGIPKRFNWKRCLIRTIIVTLMILVGETIPQFGLILSLVGGSTITLTTFVLPPYFYMKLCDKQSSSWERKFIPLHERVYMWELIFIGIIGGMASTFSAITAIFGYSLATPCYWSR